MMQLSYHTAQTAYSKFYYNLKTSFKEKNSLLSCPSSDELSTNVLNQICESLVSAFTLTVIRWLK